jgi:hypothetical protein
MMRFVWIGDQINDDGTEFAIYDTVHERFVEDEAGGQTWESMEDFIDSNNGHVIERCHSIVEANLKLHES